MIKRQCLFFAAVGVTLASCAPVSMVPAAEKVVSARLGGGDGITYPGSPIETPTAVCGEVQGPIGDETFVALINTEPNGVRSIGEVDMTPRSEVGPAIAAVWNPNCGGKITIGPR